MQAIAHGSMRYSLAVWMCIPKPCPSPLGALSAIPCVSAEKMSPPYIAAVLQSVGHGENNELVLSMPPHSRRHLTCSANVGRTREPDRHATRASSSASAFRKRSSYDHATTSHKFQQTASGVSIPSAPSFCITVGQQNHPTTRNTRSKGNTSRPPCYPHNPFTDGLNMPTPESPPPRKRGISFGSTCGGNECHWQPQFLASCSAVLSLSPQAKPLRKKEKLATFRGIPIR
ncbi:hypothetical protein V8C44DRAFT_336136 [Trichoderma aethiopicum]